MTKQLNDKQIQQLVKAYVEFKKAEDTWKQLKSELTDDLEPGRYESEYGRITKSTMKKKITNWKSLLEHHPELDTENYTDIKDVTSVTVLNYNTKTSIFG